MKSVIFSSLLFMCSFCYGNDTLIWRSIPINDGKTIALMAPVSTLEDVSLKDSKKEYHLIPGSFVGADSISFSTQNSLIVGITFHYGAGHTFDEYLQTFQKALEREPEVTIKKNGTRIASWQDPYTKFTLCFIVKGQTTFLFSTIEDL